MRKDYFMKYISTRGLDNKGVSSAYAIKNGLALDGGLYMPESIPFVGLDFFDRLVKLSYAERAACVLSLFLSDYTLEELMDACSASYSEERFVGGCAPVKKLDGNLYMLELWHGPTCAFKDMALQLMPRLFSMALKKCNEQRKALILVATSGDTGKAALEGYRNIDGTMIEVFYPTDGVSRVQKLQMQTQEGSNLSVLGINGNFDDAQSGVKRIFGDKSFSKALDERGIFLSSANSINWGRLVPQIAYYISAYCDLVSNREISLGEEIDVCVPTGNFGNIFACYIAKRMGLPINKLVCASNKNNVLTDFLKTGVYDRNRIFYTTVSPSMDILISSNLERLLFLTLGHERTKELMKKLNDTGKYELTADEIGAIQEVFVGYCTEEEETLDTIKSIYEKKNCLIDTHTAVAVSASLRYLGDYKAERKILAVSTASPYKFARDVYRALVGITVDDLDALEALHALTGVDIPYPLADLTKKPVLHGDTIDKGDMEKAVLSFAEN